MVSEILNLPNATKVFDSAQIPGEIIDMMVANTEVVAANPDFGKALAGIWYDTMAVMTANDDAGAAARAAMGAASGTDQLGFEAQLAATKLFPTPAEAVTFTTSPDLKTTMEKVRTFLFDKGLLGSGAPSADVIGIELPGGEVLGDAANVKLRFSDVYMKAAADGTL
jgi:NitT/TauT family transport system substrate-binding protein